MAIENDPKIRDRNEQVRQVQEYAERQARLQEEQDRQQAPERLQAQAGAEVAAQPSETEAQQAERDVEAEREIEAQDVQAQIQAQEVAQVNESREASGQELSDDAVEAASAQQDRGEQWQSFSADEAREKAIPPSIEDQAAQERQEAQQREQQQINVGDLMKQMSIQGGKIDA